MIRTSSLHELVGSGIDQVAVACGIFDGLHRGHRRILDRLQQEAADTGAAPVVVTFDPHPQNVIGTGDPIPLLLSTDHRLMLLAQQEIAATVVIPFTESFSRITPAAFVTDVLCGSGIRVTAVCVGSRWRFGHRAAGNTDLLQQLCNDLNVRVVPVPEVDDGHGTVSSRRARAAVAAGELAACESMLGRRFSVYGAVRRGKGLGAASLTYATANIKPGNGVLPPDGIYAATARLCNDEGTWTDHPGILYQGTAPTVTDANPGERVVEMHIFEFDTDIYGRPLEIVYGDFIRADCRFDSLEALRDQIGRDIAEVRARG